MRKETVSRRRFMGSVLAAGTAPLIFPAGLFGDEAPSGKLNIACIGIGNQGGGISRHIGRHPRVQVVGLCDVDMRLGGETLGAFPNAARYEDFRVMLEELESDIDAVVVGTPDHSHFPAAIMAMSMGKHVFVEKPLANTFFEAELLMRAEEKYGVVTQMGNQGHSGANYFQSKAFAEEGLFDDIHTIISYMNSGRRWHPWGDVPGFPEGENPPEGLRWDLWHATAEERPYSGRYHPGNWRGWYRYGMGALGDWGPHILDTAHRFMELGLPTRIEPVHIKQHNPYIFPLESTIKFTFPDRGAKPPVTVYWYDGTGNRPQLPPEFAEMGIGNIGSFGNHGRFLVGEKHIFHGGSHGDALRVIPEARRQEVQQHLPRFSGGTDHYYNFVLAALGETTANSPFSVAGVLNQMFNLGVIAMELNEALTFNPQTKRFVDNDAANALLFGPPPRAGWEGFYKL